MRAVITERNQIVYGLSRANRDLANAQADVIVLAWTAAGDHRAPKHVFRNEAWRNMPAVKTGRAVVIRNELLNTPGPPLVDGAWELFCAVHPEGRPRSNQRC